MFEKLLQNENIRPSVVVSQDGALEVTGVDKKSDEINIREHTSIATEFAVEVRN